MGYCLLGIIPIIIFLLFVGATVTPRMGDDV